MPLMSVTAVGIVSNSTNTLVYSLLMELTRVILGA
jgi:hypothetical protein